MATNNPTVLFIESFPFHYVKKHGNPADYPIRQNYRAVSKAQGRVTIPAEPDLSLIAGAIRLQFSEDSCCLISLSISSKIAAASLTSSGHGRLA